MSIKIGYVGQFLFVFQQQKKVKENKKEENKNKKKEILRRTYIHNEEKSKQETVGNVQEDTVLVQIKT